MTGNRTTLSFLDLALMLLSAFAYSHFIGLADKETREEMAKAAEAERTTGLYEYDAAALFGSSNVMLTDFAYREIADRQAAHQGDLLVIKVPADADEGSSFRLRQWEKVAARSAAIADAFAAAGQDGRMIEVQMPDKVLSDAENDRNITLVFLTPEKEQTAP